MGVPLVEPVMPVSEEERFFVGDLVDFGVSACGDISWERGLFEVSLVAVPYCQALMGFLYALSFLASLRPFRLCTRVPFIQCRVFALAARMQGWAGEEKRGGLWDWVRLLPV